MERFEFREVRFSEEWKPLDTTEAVLWELALLSEEVRKSPNG